MKKKLLKEDIEKLEQMAGKRFDSLKDTIEQIPEQIILSTPLTKSLKKLLKRGT